MSRPQRRFSSEFKQEAVALVRRSGQSANQVANEAGGCGRRLFPPTGRMAFRPLKK